jgi:hypothetical protein
MLVNISSFFVVHDYITTNQDKNLTAHRKQNKSLKSVEIFCISITVFELEVFATTVFYWGQEYMHVSLSPSSGLFLTPRGENMSIAQKAFLRHIQ